MNNNRENNTTSTKKEGDLKNNTLITIMGINDTIENMSKSNMFLKNNEKGN